jgi:hypothetical protein
MVSGKQGLRFLLIGSFVLVLGLNPLAGYLVLKRLEKKAGAPIQGKFVPSFVLPAFTLKNSSFDWQGRFRVVSGTVRVRYNPFFLIPGQKLRVQLVGEKLPVRFSGELAASEGFSEMTVEHAVADFAIADKGPPEIYLLDIRSPEMTFRLAKEGENLSKTVKK